MTLQKHIRESPGSPLIELFWLAQGHHDGAQSSTHHPASRRRWWLPSCTAAAQQSDSSAHKTPRMPASAEGQDLLQLARHLASCLHHMSPAGGAWSLYAGVPCLLNQFSWLPSAATYFTAPAVLAFLGRRQAARCLTWLADLPTDPSALMTSTQVTKASLSVA